MSARVGPWERRREPCLHRNVRAIARVVTEVAKAWPRQCDSLYNMDMRHLPVVHAIVSDMADLGEVIAANMRGERARRRLTQDDLAQRVGWSRQVVWQLESNGRVLKVAELPALCRALDVSLLELARGADPDDLAAIGL
jgi:DNA-binding XRE family transcriptional regulator